jgi:hypothetical protein
MAQTGEEAWWTEVEHLRDGLERRRREAEGTGFDRVAARPGGRFARGQQELLTRGERDSAAQLVDAELAGLASPSRRARRTRGSTPEVTAVPRRRSGRFDRAGGDDHVLLVTPLDPPVPGPPEPDAGADPRADRPVDALLALDVPAWQDARRASAAEAVPGIGAPGRRTVQIRGRGTEGRTEALLSDRARRPSRTVSERVGPRPDRLALWALVLGFVLILAAVATG